jgi:hypothetical protein
MAQVLGLALSVLTEPQLNPEDGHYDKQDCETKAFRRTLLRLKEAFPREPIVHLLDSLYCQGPIFQDITDCAQKFIACSKRGAIPTLKEDAYAGRLKTTASTNKRPATNWNTSATATTST